MVKKKKIILSITMILLLVMINPLTVSAAGHVKEKETVSVQNLQQNVRTTAAISTNAIKEQITSTYEKAKKLRNRTSFHGWCGDFVAAQLEAMGISYKTTKYFNANGNTWFTGLLNNVETDSGHIQVKYAGKNCLKNLVDANKGQPIFNIVVSWPNSSGNGPYGHVCFIHAIIDGKVYYCESYSTSKGAEGTPLVADMNSMLESYNNSYGDALGAVYFSGASLFQSVTDQSLFSTYAFYLNNRAMNELMISAAGNVAEALSGNTTLVAHMSGIKDGLEIDCKSVLAELGLTSSYTDDAIDRTTISLITKLMGSEDYMKEQVKNIWEDFSIVKETYDLGKELDKLQQAELANKLLGINKEDFLKKFDEASKNTGLIKTIAKQGITLGQLIIADIQLEYLNRKVVSELMQELQDCGQAGSDLYTGLYRLDYKLRQSASERIFNDYLDEATVSLMVSGASKVIVSGMSKGLSSTYTVASIATKLAVKVFYEKMFNGAMMKDWQDALMIWSFFKTLDTANLEMYTKLLNGENKDVHIQHKHRLLWEGEVKALILSLEKAKKVTADSTIEANCESYRKSVDRLCTYDRYFKLCKSEALKAVNQGTAYVIGKVETESHIKDSMNVISERFKNLTALYVPGESEFNTMYNSKMGSTGFVEFSFKMLFGNTMDFTISTKHRYHFSSYNSVTKIGEIAGADVSEEKIKTLLQDAQIGDVIQGYGASYGSHTMIFKEFTSNGILVYDCNWDTKKNGDNKVLLHELTYTEIKTWIGTGTQDSNGGMALYHAVNYNNMYSQGTTICADDRDNFQIENGVLVKYTGYRNFVIIPSTVKEIGKEAFLNNGAVQMVEIPSSVTSIGERAFYGCSMLTSVFIPDSVTVMGRECFRGCTSMVYAKLSQTMEIIPDSCFYECKSLETVMMGMKVTNIESSTFYNCVNLSDIELAPNLKILGQNAFYNCDSITEVEIPNTLVEDNDSWISEGPFNYCDNLKTVTMEEGLKEIPKYLCNNVVGLEEVKIPEGITKIGSSSFEDCKNLRTIVIPDSVTEICPAAFRNCENLTGVEFGQNLERIDWDAFRFCTNLTDVKLPPYLLALENNAFGKCEGIKEIKLPKTLSESTSWGTEGPFSDCGNLKTVTFEEGMKEIPDYIFSNVPGLEEIKIPEGITKIGRSSFGHCKNLRSVIIADSVTEIKYNTFWFCENLTSVKFGENIEKIAASAFYHCTKLTDVLLPPYLSVLEDSAFGECDAIKEIRIPKSLTDPGSWSVNLPFVGCDNLKTVTFEKGMKEIPRYLFSNVPGLEEIEIPEGITSIGLAAFEKCTNLKTVKLPNSLSKIESNVFNNCSSLTEINLPSKISEIGYSVFKDCKKLQTIHMEGMITKIGKYAFSGCSKLKSIALNKGLETIEDCAFVDCASLSKVTIPDGIRWIGESTFKNCDNLLDVELPESLETIHKYAFYDCDRLNTITVPSKVTGIKEYAFSNCDSLSAVTVNSQQTYDIASYAFSDNAMLQTLILSQGLREIGNNAFDTTKLSSVELPYGVTSIGEYAFAHNTKLTQITILETVTKIAANAFSYPTRMKIYGVAGTYAETYANEKNITFESRKPSIANFELTKSIIHVVVGKEYKIDYKLTPETTTEHVTWTADNTAVTILSDDRFLVKNAGCYTITGKVGTLIRTFKVFCTNKEIQTSSIEDLDTKKWKENTTTCIYSGKTDASYYIIEFAKKDKGQKSLYVFNADGTIAKECNENYLPETVKVNGNIVTIFSNGVDYKVVSLTGYNNNGTVVDKNYCDRTLSISGYHPDMTVGDTQRLSLSTNVECYSYSWKSSNLSVVTVDQSGNVHALKAGTAIVTVSSGDKTASITIKVNEEKKIHSIKDCTVSLSTSSYEYDGKEKRPAVTIQNQKVKLVEGTDYTVSYKNNINAGTASITVMGVGNYEGSITKTFTIKAAVISKCKVSLSTTNYTYDGKKKSPSVLVKFGSKTLANGKDYTVSYKNNSNLGTASVIINGIHNYNGSVIKNYVISFATTSASVSNVSSGVQIKWNKIYGAAGYNVYRKTNSGSLKYIKNIKGGTTTSYTDTATSSGTTYSYAVRAYSKNILSPYKMSLQIKYLKMPAKCSLYNDAKGITVKWEKSKGATGYCLYRKTQSGSWSQIATIKKESSISYTDTKVKDGTLYYYRICAYSGKIKSAYKGSSAIIRLSAPKISSLKSSSSGKITVKWNKNSKAQGYQISYKVGKTVKTKTVSKASITNIVIGSLKRRSTYTVCIRCYKKVGKTTYYSAWSSTKKIKVK